MWVVSLQFRDDLTSLLDRNYLYGQKPVDLSRHEGAASVEAPRCGARVGGFDNPAAQQGG
jgi:hypothetical protein